MNIDLTGVPVSAVSHIFEYMLRWVRDSFDLDKSIFQDMTIVGIAMDRFGSSKPAAFTGCRNTDFTSKLVPLVCFSFTNAFYRWLVDTVDFVFVIPLLVENSGGDIQQ